MSLVRRGVRTNYDNIAVGSAWLSPERVIGQSTSNLSAVSDPSLYNAELVSPYGRVEEGLTAGSSGGTFDNISNGNLPGVEDVQNELTGKLTTDGEDVQGNGP